MMIVMKQTATEDEIRAVIDRIESVGARAHPSTGDEVTVIGAIGDLEHIARLELQGAPGVDRVVPILKPYKLASSQLKHGERTVLEIGGRKIGGEHFALIAGPCTVESRDQMLTTAEVVAQAGATMVRGGAYKPRTSPYAFQGLGQEGLRLLAEAKEQTGLPIVTELMDARDLEPVLEVADVIQIGARNMQNYSLLSEIGRSGCPVLIKRGLSSTLEELLMAAEYVLKEGNEAVILCERGIRTFETAYRFTLDLTAVPGAQGAQPPAGHRRPQPRGGPARPRRAAEPRRRRGRRRRHHRRGAPRSRERHLRRAAGAAHRGLRRLRGPRAGGGRGRGQGRLRRRLIVAVVGVGLIGGSVGLAARSRLGATVRGFDPRADEAVARGAIHSAHRDLGDALDGADAVFVAVPVDVLADTVATVLAQAPRSARRHRRRLDQAHGHRRRARPALRRRPPAGGLGGGRRRARARGPLRRRHLVPDADRDDAGHAARAPAPAAHRAWARGPPSSTPTSTTA